MDLVFLDIAMPEVTGVLHAIGADAMPLLSFVTIVEEYALRAFEAHAFDYLLKLFGEDCFYAALDRARTQRHVSGRGGEERMEALQVFLRNAKPGTYPDGVALPAGERYQIVRVQEIPPGGAAGSYIRLNLPHGSPLMRQTIRDLEEGLLHPGQFLPAYRSAIENLSHTVAAQPVSRAASVAVLAGSARNAAQFRT